MELLNKQETITTTVVFTLQDETGAFYYKEWINDGGEVVDSMMVDKDGYQINDPVLLEEVESFLVSIGE
jgi:hypothetical protein